MNYASLALTALKIVMWLLDQWKATQQFNAGVDSEVARAAGEVLRRTEAGKKIMERLDAMDAHQRDDLTDDLGRG